MSTCGYDGCVTHPDEPRAGFLTIRFCGERCQKLAEIVILPGDGAKIAIPLDVEHMHADTGTPLDREVTQR